jgi:YVTN family beta-propeller protein
MNKRYAVAAVSVILIASAITRAGTLVVLNKSDATASFLDTATGKSIATIAVGDGPHEAAASPDSSLVVVCNYGARAAGSTLTVIDVKSQRAIKTIDLAPYHRPHGVEFLEDDKRVLVTAEAEKKLLIVNIETGKVEAAIDTDQQASHMVAASRDGSLAFVANIGSGSVSVIDLNKRELQQVIQTGAGTEGVFVHPTRDEVWVTNTRADSVSVVDMRTLEVVAVLKSGGNPIRVAITPGGAYAMVSCARAAEVWVYDTATHDVVAKIVMDEEPVSDDEKQTRLFSDRFDQSPVPVGIQIQPDGKLAYVSNTNADVISVIDLSTWKIVNRLRAGKEPDGMTWIP